MLFPITMPGKIRFSPLSHEKFPIKYFKDFIASALTSQGIMIHENTETEINFKVPLIIIWKWDTSILFLISKGEIEFVQEDNEFSIKYRLNLSRLFLYILVPALITVVLEFSFQTLIFYLILLLLFISIFMILVISGFRRLIKRCFTEFSQRRLYWQ